MAVTITLRDDEAIFTLSAIQSSVERMREFCDETDHKYGKMNDIYRHHIRTLKSSHETIRAAVNERGYSVDKIEDEEIDTKIKE